MVSFDDIINRCRDISQTTHNRPLFVGMGGGECSGKSYLAAQLHAHLQGERNVIVVPMDGYLVHSRVERARFDSHSHDIAVLAKYIGDHPESFDVDLLRQNLDGMVRDELWYPRQYDYEHGHVTVDSSPQTINAGSIVIVEGLFALADQVCDMLDVKVFVMTSVDVMRERYVRRHEKRKTKTRVEILNTFERLVLPAYDAFIAPTAQRADYVLHNDEESGV